MTPTTIFCDSDFVHPLQKAFPETQILEFSKTIDQCLKGFEASDKAEVWMVYQALAGHPGNVSVKDHINLSPDNPLFGPADLSQGPRFPDMSSVYADADLDGVLVVFGQDEDLKNFNEPWFSVGGGVWEAIALKHRGYSMRAWLIEDLEKWINEVRLLK